MTRIRISLTEPLTADFRATIAARIKRDPEFAKALQNEVQLLLGQGDSLTAIVLIRDLIESGWHVDAMQKLLGSLTMKTTLAEGQNEPVLYLDFDGVLHPYEDEDRIFEIPERVFFKFAPLLEAQLEPYP